MMKRFLLHTFVMSALLGGMASAAWADTNDGLVLYLPFDKAPSNNVVPDESGLNNNGTVNGPVFVPNAGWAGGAFQFDGVNDYIFIPKHSSLNVGAGAGLTLSAWYNTSTDSNINKQSPLLEWSPGFQGIGGRAGIHLWVNTEGFQWHPPTNPNGGGTGANLVAAGIPFPDNEWNYVISTSDRPRNEWHHLVVTYDRASAQAKVYVDGNLDQTRTFSESIQPDTNDDLYLGLRPTDHQRMKGLLDEVRVYNRALAAEQVQALYAAVNSGKIFQNFETNNGSDQYGWTWDPSHVTAGLTTERAHAGTRSWKIVSTVQDGGTGIQSQQETWHFKARPGRHDRLTFWIWANPSNNQPNNVAMKLFDHNEYSASGFEVWTTKSARVRGWDQLTVLLTQLPDDFNLDDIDKIEFKNYWPGTYYIDDIQVSTSDRAYQGFEADRAYQTNDPRTCSALDSSSAGNCGWAWFGSAAVTDDIIKEGQQSWKLTLNDFWGGTGIKSQEQRLCVDGECSDLTDPSPEQSFWHVDLNPSHLLSMGYDHLSFWLYSQGENEMDNNMGVQFFDWGNYHTDPIPDGFYDKQVVWARKGAVNGQWTRLSVPLDVLPSDFDLTDINKIQLQSYWPGTYYLDGIKAGKELPVIDQAALPTGTIHWTRLKEAFQYTLQESTAGSDGPWQTIYTGTNSSFKLSHLSSTWLRVRGEAVSKESGAEVYTYDWSDPVQYIHQPVLLRQGSLQQGKIELKSIPQASLYEIQQSSSKTGPWTLLYKGSVPPAPLTATLGQWYRARAVIDEPNGQTIDATDWSPQLLYNPTVFVKAVSTVLKEQNGSGDVITLRGTNLGNALLIEPWMFFGLNHPAVKKPDETGYDPDVAVNDDWKVRDILVQRFGAQSTAELIKSYQDTYLQAIDFDHLLRLGTNVVRLPIYYRDIRELNASLNWTGTAYKFDHIDRLIEMAADRGLYVLLDLHGAPGAQSDQDNTGRLEFNQLFNEDQQVTCGSSTVTIGECYRRRTVELWKAIASRYKNNTAVVGYDLLNEPAGAQSPSVLRSMYDRLYDAIRPIDPNHLIVMEGLWVDQERWPSVNTDWDWLPDPKTYAWTNVAYQFHYYCWSCSTGSDPVPVGTQITRQSDFLDEKFDLADTQQPAYDVPLLIGEFTGFGVKTVWEDYLNRFNQHGWSWTNWAYKTHDSPSEWGLYTHLIFNKDLPDFRNDSLDDIKRKLLLFDTARHHTPNVSLNELVKTYASQSANQPPVLSAIGAKTINEGQLLTITLSASDANGDALTYSASSLPTGATFDPQSRKFTWTPGFNQSGAYNVTFMVSDDILKDQEKVVITVRNVALSVSSVSDSPDPFSPNGDGRKDSTTLKGTLNHTASWTLTIKTSSGTVVRTFTGSGSSISQVWDGKNSSGVVVSNAVYTYVVSAADAGGSTASRSSQVTVDNTRPVVSVLTDTPDPFRPSTGQTTTISYTLSEPATATLRIYNSSGTLIRTLLSGVYQTTLTNSVIWDGKNSSGVVVSPGTYTYRLWIEDMAQNRTSPYPVSSTVTVQ